MYLNNFVLYSIIFIAVILTGCAKKIYPNGEDFSDFQKPIKNSSIIYIYTLQERTGHEMIFINEDKKDYLIGDLVSKSYSIAEVGADKEIKIWAETESIESITIDTEAGKIYCIKADIGGGIRIYRPTFEQVDLETCKAEISKTKLVR